MSAWSNIEISAEDPEIIAIDKIEKSLGEIPQHILQIRNLITRFEVCHFKIDQHLKKIKDSIFGLSPVIEPESIGANHIRMGEDASKKDKTGRSLLGLQYLIAVKRWLSDDPGNKKSKNYDEEIDEKVTEWLGSKTPGKEKLIRLLIARMTWDWKSYEELTKGEKLEGLKYQVCTMDICHYAFPENLNKLLQGIGKMKQAEGFEGCGDYNEEIREFLGAEFSGLYNRMKTNRHKSKNDIDGKESLKYWLVACFAKTLKEQLGIKKRLPIPGIE
ncbi:MAG: hypothetical protein PVH88_20985 [Ignavibacteria bacterium]|jgi:hypothetical protein